MSPKLDTGKLDRRSGALAVVAIICIGTLAAKGLRREPGEDAESAPTSTRPRVGAVAAVGSAGSGRDRGTLDKAFHVIVEADPFRVRSFKKKAETKPSGDSPRPTRTDDKPSGPEVAMIALRLTGVFSLGDGLGAFLENRGDGKGLYVRAGDRFGSRTIASVQTDSILVAIAVGAGGTAPVDTADGVAKVETKTIALGDKVDLVAADLAGKFTDLAIATTTSASSSSSGGSKSEPRPVLTEEKKNEVLEKLKNRRKQSLGNDAGGPGKPDEKK